MIKKGMTRLAGAAFALVLDGCGGGGGGDPEPVPTPPPQIVNGSSRSTATTKWVTTGGLSCGVGNNVAVWFGADGTCGQHTSFGGCLTADCTWTQNGATVTMGNMPSSVCIASITNIEGSTLTGSMSGTVTRADGVRLNPAGFVCSFTLTNCAGAC